MESNGNVKQSPRMQNGILFPRSCGQYLLNRQAFQDGPPIARSRLENFVKARIHQALVYQVLLVASLALPAFAQSLYFEPSNSASNSGSYIARTPESMVCVSAAGID